MCVAQFLQCAFNRSFLVGRNLIAQILKLVFCLENHAVGLVQFVDFLFCLFVGFGILFCFCLHTVYFIFAQSAGSFYSYSLFFSGSFVFCRNFQYTVCINIEQDFNLRHSTTCGSNTCKVELPYTLVLCCHRTLALQYMYCYLCLVVSSC